MLLLWMIIVLKKYKSIKKDKEIGKEILDAFSSLKDDVIIFNVKAYEQVSIEDIDNLKWGVRIKQGSF